MYSGVMWEALLAQFLLLSDSDELLLVRREGK